MCGYVIFEDVWDQLIRERNGMLIVLTSAFSNENGKSSEQSFFSVRHFDIKTYDVMLSAMLLTFKQNSSDVSL